jgi:hypothetical protein
MHRRPDSFFSALDDRREVEDCRSQLIDQNGAVEQDRKHRALAAGEVG